MRTLIKLLILPAISFISGCNGALRNQDFQKESGLLEAVDEVMSSFGSSAVTMNFLMSLSDETKQEQNILINKIVSRWSVGTAIVEDVEFITPRHRLHNVIFIDDFKSFLAFADGVSSKNFVIDGYFLFVLLKGPIAELSEIVERLWSFFVYKIDFLIEGDDGVSLSTFFPFSATNCHDSTPVVIKRFNGSSNGSENFYPEKLSNMFQCPVKVVTFNTPPMMMISNENNETKTFDLKGVDGEMLKLLSKTINFKIDLFHISDLIRWGSLQANGTATGAMKMIVNNEADLTIGMYTITFLRSQFMTSSELYFSVPFILIVPPGLPFSPFEKLFRPFDLTVWILLLLVFISAVVVVTFIKFQTISMRNFVFGRNNTSPYMNILSVFVGVSLTRLPDRNFARYLLAAFLLFSIVKRTLYQGALFKFLQAEDGTKQIQTIDELVEKGLKVYMMPSSIEHTNSMKFRHKREVVNSTIIEIKKQETLNPHYQAAVTSSIEQVLYYNKINYKNNTLTICLETLFTFQYGIYFRKNSYLQGLFNEKISTFKSSGLIEFWASDFINMKYLNIKLAEDSPRKLNIEQLRGGFEVLYIGVSVGFVLLLCEIVSTWLGITKLQKLIEFFT